MDKSECCPICKRYTERGKQQESEAYRKRPLSGIDLSQPLSGLVEKIRSDLVTARSQLQDIGWGYTGWADRLVSVQGLLTCGLVSLHHTMMEMREHERQRAEKLVDGEKPL